MKDKYNRGFELLIGKTVKSIDSNSINCVTLFFTDGTSVILDTEAVGYGLYSPIVGNPEDYQN